MIKRCICVHKAQDKLNGIGMRVKNPTRTNTNKQEFRCTVCGRTS